MRSVPGGGSDRAQPATSEMVKTVTRSLAPPGTDLITISRPLVLRRRRTFRSIQIDLTQGPFVLQHERLWWIVTIDIYGFGDLISDRDLIVILRPGYPDLNRQ